MNEISSRIKELRKDLGLTTEKFGEPLGVTRAAISNIENGNRNVTEQMIKSICARYCVREEWLRDGIGDMYIKFPTDSDAPNLPNFAKLSSYKHIQDALSVISELDSEYLQAFDTFLEGLEKKKGQE